MAVHLRRGSRYPMALTDSHDAPQTVAGTGTKIEGTNTSLGMGGSIAITIDKTLNGQWKAIRFSAEGKDVPDAAIENLSLTFANGKYVMNMGPELQTGTYDVNTSGSPMSMTINIGSGDKKGQKRHGSFKLLKDNRLLIVFATNETGHPTKFVPDESGDSIMAVYQKAN